MILKILITILWLTHTNGLGQSYFTYYQELNNFEVSLMPDGSYLLINPKGILEEILIEIFHIKNKIFLKLKLTSHSLAVNCITNSVSEPTAGKLFTRTAQHLLKRFAPIQT